MLTQAWRVHEAVARVREFLELVRAPNSLMMGAAVAVALAVAGRWDLTVIGDLIIWAPLAGVMVAALVMITNDIVDLPVDRVNAPWRPLPSGLITIQGALILALAASWTGLAFSAMAGVVTVISFIAAGGLGVAYNFHLKRTGLPGNITVALLVASPFIYASVALGRVDELALIFSVMIFLSVLAREVVKGIPDVEGDARVGVKTLAVVLGPRAASRVAGALYMVAVAASLLPPARGLVNELYTIPVILLDAVMVFESLKLMARTPSREEALRHKDRVLLYMMIALVALALGSMPGVEVIG